jgi:hypothetical protein
MILFGHTNKSGKLVNSPFLPRSSQQRRIGSPGDPEAYAQTYWKADRSHETHRADDRISGEGDAVKLDCRALLNL